MKTFQIVLSVLVTLGILIGTAFFLIGYFKPKPGGIFVDTSPASGIYIDDNFVGKTPFQKAYPPGEVILKLVPLVSDQNLLPFETKITLIPGIQTVVRREFGKTEDDSSGDIISFDKEGGANAGLLVISTPDNAQVSLDGIPRGFAPYKTTSISPADHQITIKAPGYTDRVMTIKTKVGYRLTLFAKLAKAGDKDGTEIVATPAPESKLFITISKTQTGYLRVRTEPGTKGDEIGQVNEGQKFPYLDTDTDTGWYKIQFEEPTEGLPNGIVGWVSNQYSVKSGQDAVPTASPNVSTIN